MKIDDRQLWRFDIYSVQAERGENPEDLYYLCNVRDSWYIVFETDYIHSLEEAFHEAVEIFESDVAKITHWLGKLEDDSQIAKVPLERALDRTQYSKLILDADETYLRYAVLVVEVGDNFEEGYL